MSFLCWTYQLMDRVTRRPCVIPTYIWQLSIGVLTSGSQTLDIQYTVGIATDVPTTLVTIAPGQQFMAFLTLFNYLLDQEDVPLVVTTSYGFDEDALRQDLVTSVQAGYILIHSQGELI